jgi:hypothetical protein
MQFLLDNSLLIIVIVITVIALALPVINTRRYAPMVSPKRLTEIVNKENGVIIDVRKADDFRRTLRATFPPIRSRTVSANSTRAAPSCLWTARAVSPRPSPSFCAAWVSRRSTSLRTVSSPGRRKGCPSNNLEIRGFVPM